MELKTDRSCHARYNLEYHLILVTKYRKKCITQPVFDTIHRQSDRIVEMNGGSIEEINFEADHVHMLLSMPPQCCLSTVINSIKTTSSRLVRKEHAAYLARFFWKPYFWGREYMILSSGGAPIDVIKAYIQEQGTEKHNKKKRPAITT